MTARNWARFGETIRLDGRGVLKPGQVKRLWEATAANPTYGLTWWLPTAGAGGAVGRALVEGLPNDVRMAAGAGGQRLYVIPSRELVVVRQAPVRGGERFQDGEFLRRLLK
jgi:CubicO group peptidase (beta-lactamase class C family)